MGELSKIYENIKISNLSKKDISKIAESESEFIKENGGALEAFSFLKKVEHLVKTTLDKIKDNALNDVLKGVDYAYGVKCSASGKTTYYYDNDRVWCDLRDKLKEREKLLSAIKGSLEVINEETGEIETLYPPYSKVSEYVKTEF